MSGLWIWRDFVFPSLALFSQAHSYTSMPTDYKNDSWLLPWEPKNQFQHSKLGNTEHETLQIRAVYYTELFVQMMTGQKTYKRFLKICFFKCFYIYFIWHYLHLFGVKENYFDLNQREERIWVASG